MNLIQALAVAKHEISKRDGTIAKTFRDRIPMPYLGIVQARNGQFMTSHPTLERKFWTMEAFVKEFALTTDEKIQNVRNWLGHNPFDHLEFWDVCDACKELIKKARKSSSDPILKRQVLAIPRALK